MELSILTHTPLQHLLELDDATLATYVDVLKEHAKHDNK